MPKYKRSSDGYFHAKVWTGTWNKGKKVYKSITSKKSSTDLERKVAAYKLSVEQSAITVPNDINIVDYGNQWLEVYKANREASTKDMYYICINKHLSSLSDCPISALSTKAVQIVINNIAEHPRTCQQVSMTLKQILKSAEHDKIVPKGFCDEIFFRLEIPKYKAVEKEILTDIQKQDIFDAKLSPKERAFVSIIYYCGLRREETLALTWEDVNLDNSTITIKKALGFDNRTYSSYIKSPKTDNGYRTVPMPSALNEILSEYRESFTQDNQYLFTQKGGGLMTNSSYTKMWAQIRKKTGHPEITAHQFRHNYCTHLCYQPNLSIKKIAALLGDTEKMVLEVYSHIREEQESVTEAIEGL